MRLVPTFPVAPVTTTRIALAFPARPNTETDLETLVRFPDRGMREGRTAMRIGYFLSSEEYDPRELVEQARLAQRAGLDRLWISDHYHPWTDAQGQSGFVWSVIGALATAVPGMHVTTAVTCPTVRIHPAIVAQAAATSALLLDGRFSLGVGSGEALNEHILGDHWPEADVRLEMLEEAVEVIRGLWAGGQYSHRGDHYTVENARIYSLPDAQPKILVSGFGPKAIELAARIGDGYCGVMPEAEIIERFRTNGGGDKLAQGGTKVCWGPRRGRMLSHSAPAVAKRGARRRLPQDPTSNGS
jgi:G6PDH family F420-dependent oxidoreductase